MTDDFSNVFIPIELQEKMSMNMGSSSSSNACKISMLWNWYTINSCFLARSWHVTSRGMFAGTCIGIFFWVMAYCWFHRFIVEYDNAILEYKIKKYNMDCKSCCGEGEGEEENGCCNNTNTTNNNNEIIYANKESSSSSSSSDNDRKKAENNEISNIQTKSPGSDFWTPLKNTFSHKWYFAWIKKEKNTIYPNPIEHVGRSGLYLMEWTVSYLIMLLWMYYNGYLIITMILGYFFGQLFFNYTPLTVIPKKNYTTPGCE